MLKKILFVAVTVFFMVACSGDDPADKLVGKWSGTITSSEGESITADYEFLEDGKMVAVALPGVLDVVQTGTWRIAGNGDFCMTLGEGADEGCSSLEFIGDSTIKIIGNTNGSIAEMVRQEE